MKNKLLVLCRDHEVFEAELQRLDLPDLEIHIPRSDDQIKSVLSTANIIFANPPIARRYVNQASNLTWLQSTFAGVDALIDPSLRSDYRLTIVKDTYGLAMAEYVFGYILMFEREVLENIGWQKIQRWNQKGYSTLESKTLGILGTGSIGRSIAKIAKGFGMRVLGFRTRAEAVPDFDQVYDRASLPELMAASDFVVSVLPSTADTFQIVDRHLLSNMQAGSVFMNIGRGANVCEQDLIAVLEAKQIKAAVLDVFDQEPLPENHPFWLLPNVYVTPHVSGYIETGRFFEIFEQNYHRFRNGEELLYQVDFKRGY